MMTDHLSVSHVEPYTPQYGAGPQGQSSKDKRESAKKKMARENRRQDQAGSEKNQSDDVGSRVDMEV